MIRVDLDNGEIKVSGSIPKIAVELTILLRKIRELIDDEELSDALIESIINNHKKTDEEIKKEADEKWHKLLEKALIKATITKDDAMRDIIEKIIDEEMKMRNDCN